MTVLATAFFAMLDTSMQYVATAIPVVMALWVRYCIQTAFSAVAVYRLEGRLLPKVKEPGLQIFRGLLFVLTSIFAFLSLRHVSVGEFAAVMMMTPVVVSVLVAFLSREAVRPLRWVLLAVSVAGTITVIRPGSRTISWMLLYPLGALVSNTFFLIVTSRLASKDTPLSTHFYSGLLGVIVLSILLPRYWSVDASALMWSVLALGAVAASCGHILLVSAYQYAPASVLTPYLYIQLPFATFAGWLVFAKAVDVFTFIGIGFIIAAGTIGTLLTHRERRNFQNLKNF